MRCSWIGVTLDLDSEFKPRKPPPMVDLDLFSNLNVKYQKYRFSNINCYKYS